MVSRSAPADPATTALGAALLPRLSAAALPDWARQIGVTRLARVTDLDRCGVEVACAIRPAGRLLQVSNGKGATFAAARASALAEALELFASEHLPAGRLVWLPEAPTDAFWPPEFVNGHPGPLRDRTVPQAWVRGARLDRRGDVWIPASHVWCPPPGEGSVGLRTVAFTANGIGAHRDRTRARWHGLCEVLEREALCRTLPDGWTPEAIAARGLRWAHPVVDRLAAQGLRTICLDATPRGWPIPVVAVLLVDPDSGGPPIAAGYACRPDPRAAAEAALFEACQSRLTEIHGAREDVTQDRQEIPAWLASARPPRRDLSRLPAWRASMPALLGALGVAAATVDLSIVGVPIVVERVFVPGFRLSELLL